MQATLINLTRFIFGNFTDSLGNNDNNHICHFRKADKGYICNTLTESLKNQLRIKKPTVK